VLLEHLVKEAEFWLDDPYISQHLIVLAFDGQDSGHRSPASISLTLKRDIIPGTPHGPAFQQALTIVDLDTNIYRSIGDALIKHSVVISFDL